MRHHRSALCFAKKKKKKKNFASVALRFTNRAWCGSSLYVTCTWKKKCIVPNRNFHMPHVHVARLDKRKRSTSSWQPPGSQDRIQEDLRHGYFPTSAVSLKCFWMQDTASSQVGFEPEIPLFLAGTFSRHQIGIHFNLKKCNLKNLRLFQILAFVVLLGGGGNVLRSHLSAPKRSWIQHWKMGDATNGVNWRVHWCADCAWYCTQKQRIWNPVCFIVCKFLQNNLGSGLRSCKVRTDRYEVWYIPETFRVLLCLEKNPKKPRGDHDGHNWHPRWGPNPVRTVKPGIFPKPSHGSNYANILLQSCFFFILIFFSGCRFFHFVNLTKHTTKMSFCWKNWGKKTL